MEKNIVIHAILALERNGGNERISSEEKKFTLLFNRKCLKALSLPCGE
jgi:hypothetical protein